MTTRAMQVAAALGMLLAAAAAVMVRPDRVPELRECAELRAVVVDTSDEAAAAEMERLGCAGPSYELTRRDLDPTARP